MADPLADHFRRQILEGCGPDSDVADVLVAADYFLDQNDLRMAAAAYDRAYGLQPDDEDIFGLRREVLDQLKIEEHGIVFRYIPAGTFLMGSQNGDPDEKPVHPVRVGDYWMAETPLTWAAYCDLRGWGPPPQGGPANLDRGRRFRFAQEMKIRLQYCETGTLQARDWHAHSPSDEWQQGGRTMTSEELFGAVPRDDPSRPFEYNVKPLVAISWLDAEELCEQISDSRATYRLPSEAEWERAARGGRIGALYPWGNDPPDERKCDFGHFGRFAIALPQSFPPNGYGLYGMCGGVWEWTSTDYDALAYQVAASEVHPARETSRESTGWFETALRRIQRGRAGAHDEDTRERVLRGGSWADCAEACTVSFRMSRGCSTDGWSDHYNPTIGVRLCRCEEPG